MISNHPYALQDGIKLC
uniref:Uncharacterized protein n=1 Tax=Rhizophora mucronata TaxID=61149 RepID=A0A2P2R1Q6_RHIMU